MKRGWAWVALASLTLTCTRGPQRLAHAQGAASSAPPAVASAPSPVPVASSAAAPAAAGARASTARGPLRAFFDALRELGAGKRKDHVRILWLGDSHTNADFLSGAVRSSLQRSFGDGGPGFVRVGCKAYRHDGVRLDRDGKWNVDPDPPARRALQDDGVFGLGGTRAEPGAGAAFTLHVSATGAAAAAPASFELSYMLPGDAAFKLDLGGHAERVDSSTPSSVTPAGVHHLRLEAPLGSELELTPIAGAPRLLNAIIERTDGPGVVLDAAGIDGARLETPLAWNDAAFEQEVARRAPELFVLAYGTNEVFDAVHVERYGPELAALVGRVRRAAPQASCLVLGPTDAPAGDGSLPRVAEVAGVLEQAARASGCAFASLQTLMGGEGSFAKGLKAKPRLSQPDHTHLTPAGYREVAAVLVKQLLDAYSAGRSDLP